MEVDGTVFRVNPEEHSTGVWASNEILAELEMTDEMRSIVFSALKLEGLKR